MPPKRKNIEIELPNGCEYSPNGTLYWYSNDRQTRISWLKEFNQYKCEERKGEIAEYQYYQQMRPTAAENIMQDIPLVLKEYLATGQANQDEGNKENKKPKNISTEQSILDKSFQITAQKLLSDQDENVIYFFKNYLKNPLQDLIDAGKDNTQITNHVLMQVLAGKVVEHKFSTPNVSDAIKTLHGYLLAVNINLQDRFPKNMSIGSVYNFYIQWIKEILIITKRNFSDIKNISLPQWAANKDIGKLDPADIAQNLNSIEKETYYFLCELKIEDGLYPEKIPEFDWLNNKKVLDELLKQGFSKAINTWRMWLNNTYAFHEQDHLNITQNLGKVIDKLAEREYEWEKYITEINATVDPVATVIEFSPDARGFSIALLIHFIEETKIQKNYVFNILHEKIMLQGNLVKTITNLPEKYRFEFSAHCIDLIVDHDDSLGVMLLLLKQFSIREQIDFFSLFFKLINNFNNFVYICNELETAEAKIECIKIFIQATDLSSIPGDFRCVLKLVEKIIFDDLLNNPITEDLQKIFSTLFSFLSVNDFMIMVNNSKDAIRPENKEQQLALLTALSGRPQTLLAIVCEAKAENREQIYAIVPEEAISKEIEFLQETFNSPSNISPAVAAAPAPQHPGSAFRAGGY